MKQLAQTHVLTTHGWKRRLITTLTGVAGYYIGLGVFSVETTWQQFGDVALKPYAILGIVLVVLGTSVTTGNGPKK